MLEECGPTLVYSQHLRAQNNKEQSVGDKIESREEGDGMMGNLGSGLYLGKRGEFNWNS